MFEWARLENIFVSIFFWGGGGLGGGGQVVEVEGLVSLRNVFVGLKKIFSLIVPGCCSFHYSLTSNCARLELYNKPAQQNYWLFLAWKKKACSNIQVAFRTICNHL